MSELDHCTRLLYMYIILSLKCLYPYYRYMIVHIICMRAIVLLCHGIASEFKGRGAGDVLSLVLSYYY